MKTFFTVADKSQLLKIPYGASQGSSSSNIGYIDLKIQPERISEIHELNGFPELKELILLLNKLESIFITFRTATLINFYKHSQFTNSCFSLLTIAFDRNIPNEVSSFQFLYQMFAEETKNSGVPDAVEIEFRVIPLEYEANNFIGYGLDLWLYGYGHSQDEARFNWSNDLAFLKDFLVKIDKANRSD